MSRLLLRIRMGVPLQLRIMMVALLAAFPVLFAADLFSASMGGGDLFDPCTDAPALGPNESIGAVLRRTGIDCYAIELRAGEYIKVVVEGVGTSAASDLWLPGTTGEQIEHSLAYSRGEVKAGSQVLTAVAAIDGIHAVTIGPVLDGGPALPYRIEIAELLTVHQHRERLQQGRSDPRVEWLRENALRIESVAPGNHDFSDLRPLEDILARVDVVMLGEATHSDGPTFQAKTRLVKFLHQEMGFDVLILENGLYSTWKMWEGIRGGEMEWMMYGIYNVREFQPLLQYVQENAATERPLELAGADPHGGWLADRWLEDLRVFLQGMGIDKGNEPSWEHVHTTLIEAHRAMGDFDLLPREYISDLEISAFANQAATLEEVIRSKGTDDRMASFWIQMLRNTPNWFERLMAFAEIDFTFPGRKPRPDLENADWNWCKFQNKDGQMADNLIWLTEEYFAGRKIIVWAHTGHLYRNPHTIRPPGLIDDPTGRCLFHYSRLDDFTVMGHDVYQALGERVYSVGVISYEGHERDIPINRAQVEEPELEELFFLAGHDLALLDLRSPSEDANWLHDRLYARTAPHRALRARWPAVLDAFLFIRKTRPTERLPGQTNDR